MEGRAKECAVYQHTHAYVCVFACHRHEKNVVASLSANLLSSLFRK